MVGMHTQVEAGVGFTFVLGETEVVGAIGQLAVDNIDGAPAVAERATWNRGIIVERDQAAMTVVQREERIATLYVVAFSRDRKVSTGVVEREEQGFTGVVCAANGTSRVNRCRSGSRWGVVIIGDV